MGGFLWGGGGFWEGGGWVGGLFVRGGSAIILRVVVSCWGLGGDFW